MGWRDALGVPRDHGWQRVEIVAAAEALVVASREWSAENEAVDDELRRLSPSE